MSTDKGVKSLRRGRPVWLDEPEAGPSRIYPVLSGRREVDIAIVGGGITGALVASAFAGAGLSVSVLEASLVGRGSTAASSALLLQEPDRGLGELMQRYGRGAGRRIWQVSHEAVRDFIATLRRLRIECDLVEQDAIYYATSIDSERRMRREWQRRTRTGFEAEWLTPRSLRRLTGIAGRGGIRTKGSAQFNPYQACLGLLRSAASLGAEIFEHSRVRRILPLGTGLRLETRHGRMEARRVVIATGYATAAFRPLAGRFRMYRTYVLATSPVSRTDRREIGLGDVMIWDAERPYHYARWTSDHRLLLGGGDQRIRSGQRRDLLFATATRALRDDFVALLPALADVDVEHAWEGAFATTPDSLPFIGPHRRYPKHLFALGYGGNGMTFGSLAARLLLEYWEGVRSPDQRLFSFGRFR